MFVGFCCCGWDIVLGVWVVVGFGGFFFVSLVWG